MGRTPAFHLERECRDKHDFRGGRQVPSRDAQCRERVTLSPRPRPPPLVGAPSPPPAPTWRGAAPQSPRWGCARPAPSSPPPLGGRTPRGSTPGPRGRTGGCSSCDSPVSRPRPSRSAPPWAPVSPSSRRLLGETEGSVIAPASILRFRGSSGKPRGRPG